MDDAQTANEYETRFALESLRFELRQVERRTRNWACTSVIAVAMIATSFVGVVFSSGLAAIRENTLTIRDLRALSATNRVVLESISRDMETNGLRFALLQRQIQDIDKRTAAQPSRK
jgi:hypothetical protein